MNNSTKGIIVVAIGYLIIIFGSIGMFAYGLYDIIVNFDTLTRVEIFWDIIFMMFREVIPIIVTF